MPVYRVISKELLDRWFADLDSQVLELLEYPSKNLLSYLFLRLYEYIQCYCKYELSGEGILENQKVSVSDVKGLIGDQRYFFVINSMQKIRNKAGHDSTGIIEDIVDLACWDLFYDILMKVGFSRSFCRNISMAVFFVMKSEGIVGNHYCNVGIVMKKMMGSYNKQEKLRAVLKKHGVTECYVNLDFDFESPNPDGTILINVNSESAFLDIYKLFTIREDGLVDDNQTLFVCWSDFSKVSPNFPISG